MGGSPWVFQHLFDILSAVGVVGGLFFTAFTIREDTKARKVTNLLEITANHRDVWQDYLTRPSLWRVTDPSANLDKKPVRPDEEIFANRVILHLSSTYEALKEELLVKQEGLRLDAQEFFSFPIPQAVWEKTKSLQNKDFVRFVEECRKGGHSISGQATKLSARSKK